MVKKRSGVRERVGSPGGSRRYKDERQASRGTPPEGRQKRGRTYREVPNVKKKIFCDAKGEKWRNNIEKETCKAD